MSIKNLQEELDAMQRQVFHLKQELELWHKDLSLVISRVPYIEDQMRPLVGMLNDLEKEILNLERSLIN